MESFERRFNKDKNIICTLQRESKWKSEQRRERSWRIVYIYDEWQKWATEAESAILRESNSDWICVQIQWQPLQCMLLYSERKTEYQKKSMKH